MLHSRELTALASRNVGCCLHSLSRARAHVLLTNAIGVTSTVRSTRVPSYGVVRHGSFTAEQRQRSLVLGQQWLQQVSLGQQQQQQQQRRVQTHAVQVDVLLGNLSSVSGWLLGAALLTGILLGLALAKIAANYLRKEADPYNTNLENAELRTKVEELQQLVLKVQPLAYKSMHLRFTKGINKAVILGMVDQMLANKEVNIWWLPDAIERVFYFNMMTLMLSVLDEVVDGMSISLAGHNVKLQLTHLDVARDGEAPSKQAQKTEEMFEHALKLHNTYAIHTGGSSSSGGGSGGGGLA